jgi:hypothetical protein
MGLGWVHISPLPEPYSYYEIGENPNPYQNQVKSGKTRQIGVGLGGYPWARVLLPCLVMDQLGVIDLFVDSFRICVQRGEVVQMIGSSVLSFESSFVFCWWWKIISFL